MELQPAIKLVRAEVARLPKVEAVTNTADYERGREAYKAIRAAVKTIEARRDLILAPLKVSMNETKALFKPFLDNLEAQSDELAHELGRWANLLEIQRAKAQEKLDSNTRLKSPAAIQRVQNAIPERAPGTMLIKKLVILDPEAVPDEFWILDESAIRKALLNGEVVPGAALKEELTVTSR